MDISEASYLQSPHDQILAPLILRRPYPVADNETGEADYHRIPEHVCLVGQDESTDVLPYLLE